MECLGKQNTTHVVFWSSGDAKQKTRVKELIPHLMFNSANDLDELFYIFPIVSRHNSTPLFWAIIINGDEAFIRKTCQVPGVKPATSKNFPLRKAVDNGRSDIVAFLMDQHGVSPFGRGRVDDDVKKNLSAMELAAISKRDDLMILMMKNLPKKDCPKKDPDVMKSIKICCRFGRHTALEWALQHLHTKHITSSTILKHIIDAADSYDGKDLEVHACFASCVDVLVANRQKQLIRWFKKNSLESYGGRSTQNIILTLTTKAGLTIRDDDIGAILRHGDKNLLFKIFKHGKHHLTISPKINKIINDDDALMLVCEAMVLTYVNV
jgi:hypothetical protein